MDENQTDDLRTFKQLMAHIPANWRDMEIMVGTGMRDARRILRVALHTDHDGRRVIVLYETKLKIEQ